MVCFGSISSVQCYERSVIVFYLEHGQVWPVPGREEDRVVRAVAAALGLIASDFIPIALWEAVDTWIELVSLFILVIGQRCC